MSDLEVWICEECRAGHHEQVHNRRTDTGADGGCSRAWWDRGTCRAECACSVVLTPRLNGRCPTCGTVVDAEDAAP